MANRDEIVMPAHLKRIGFKEDKDGGEPIAELTITIEFTTELRRLVSYVGKDMQIRFRPDQMALPMDDKVPSEAPPDFARVVPV